MKGPELVKKIHDGEVKDNSKIWVHRCTPLGNVEIIIEYKNGGLIWKPGIFDTSYLFDNNTDFTIEDNKIEELDNFYYYEHHSRSISEYNEIFSKLTNKINEIIRKVNEDGKK